MKQLSLVLLFIMVAACAFAQPYPDAKRFPAPTGGIFGYDPVAGVWRPLQVDTNGKISLGAAIEVGSLTLTLDDENIVASNDRIATEVILLQTYVDQLEGYLANLPATQNEIASHLAYIYNISGGGGGGGDASAANQVILQGYVDQVEGILNSVLADTAALGGYTDGVEALLTSGNVNTSAASTHLNNISIYQSQLASHALALYDMRQYLNEIASHQLKLYDLQVQSSGSTAPPTVASSYNFDLSANYSIPSITDRRTITLKNNGDTNVHVSFGSTTVAIGEGWQLEPGYFVSRTLDEAVPVAINASASTDVYIDQGGD